MAICRVRKDKEEVPAPCWPLLLERLDDLSLHFCFIFSLPNYHVLFIGFPFSSGRVPVRLNAFQFPKNLLVIVYRDWST